MNEYFCIAVKHDKRGRPCVCNRYSEFLFDKPEDWEWAPGDINKHWFDSLYEANKFAENIKKLYHQITSKWLKGEKTNDTTI